MKEDILKIILDSLTPEDVVILCGCTIAGMGVGAFIVVTRQFIH